MNPCRTVQSEKGRGARSANSCHDVTQKVRGCEFPRWCAGCELPRWWCALKRKKKGESKASLATSGEQDSRGRRWKTPLLGHRTKLVRVMG